MLRLQKPSLLACVLVLQALQCGQPAGAQLALRQYNVMHQPFDPAGRTIVASDCGHEIGVLRRDYPSSESRWGIAAVSTKHPMALNHVDHDCCTLCPWLLVAPPTKEIAANGSVYLVSGTWDTRVHHINLDQAVDGAQRLTPQGPLGFIPVCRRVTSKTDDDGQFVCRLYPERDNPFLNPSTERNWIKPPVKLFNTTIGAVQGIVRSFSSSVCLHTVDMRLVSLHACVSPSPRNWGVGPTKQTT